MKKFIQKRLNNEKGLTLVELLAVIVILGIIAAIAIPAIGGVIENSKYNAVKADALNVLSAANLYFVEDPTATDAVTATILESEGYLDSLGKIPGTASVAPVAKGENLLTTAAIEFSGTKKITFTKATITGINKDKVKGTSDGDKTISE
ncbi:prepilin-type N-terminal cleavage/methylation domain-containing protein [Sporosarcina sp. E16_8]|uniref:prepilin-type N-terminal cleavage/methylation domain-containing protein n=1 Tax=Sporosarcina sp. E16_8 TaxID=2789295 RepID=UPI001A914B59|nr:prepilin-type N-terminal cleavage/methylation domain-containing protein [Sporosarcina sp. E16_8]MBO0587094.1 prepilin-type N-terminal cleavage/methylation domain-containing protein [Sporosarcina sp. E16_8]